MVSTHSAPLTERLSDLLDDFAAKEGITRKVALQHAKMLINREANRELRELITSSNPKKEGDTIVGLLKQCEAKE
jgi:hypothetical protein